MIIKLLRAIAELQRWPILCVCRMSICYKVKIKEQVHMFCSLNTLETARTPNVVVRCTRLSFGCAHMAPLAWGSFVKGARSYAWDICC